ncbi:hypothetical protein B9Z55_015659 [Caenorhabditis nigoni]|uniref:PAN-3 domain-containing protein n=1 Tax=Caenorhabditis nigoni TaxID=1611254 RepID=A0A2G5UBJ1_9PELO|nr:hypothetical protein B9Z55_015659 [Caenorhabditis nigoni]
MSPIFLFSFLLIFQFPGFILSTPTSIDEDSENENDQNVPIIEGPVTKMIKVFGSIETGNYFPYVPEEDETCDQHCFEADYCILTVNETVKCLVIWIGTSNL